VAVQQAVSRRINPFQPGVVSFGTIQGGSARNVLADRVTVAGTLRYLDPEVKRRLVEAVEGAFGGLRAQGAEVEVDVSTGYPPVVNDPAVAGVVKRSAAAVVGERVVLPMHPFMGAEDFAYIAAEVPSAFFWVGAALADPRDHHHPRFDIDEDVLPLGAALLARAAVDLLEHAAG
jgi:metal-dependent amidase/aminoacylase/carboxypeptidase family protein